MNIIESKLFMIDDVSRVRNNGTKPMSKLIN